MKPLTKKELKVISNSKLRDREAPWKTKKFKMLERRLLKLGGKRVVHQDEPHIEDLLTRGNNFNYPITIRTHFVPHYNCECHSNTAIGWHNNEYRGFEIIVGWGLSDDGLWRQHTFGLLKERIVETTIIREIYYGVKLTFSESIDFFLSNVDSFVKIRPNKKISMAIKQKLRDIKAVLK